MMQGFDYAWGYHSGLPRTLVGAGAKFVMRYIGTSSKCLTPAERDDLMREGLGIGLYYETTGTTFKGGFAAGRADGAAAEAAMRVLNVAAGAPVWFTIDMDTSDYVSCRAYLQGAQSTLPGHTARLYGSFGVVENAGGDGHAQTYAWSSGKVSKHAGVYQYHNGVTVGGVDMDKCETLAGGPVISGGWLTYTSLIPTPAPAPSPGPAPAPAPMPSPVPNVNPRDRLRVQGNHNARVAPALAWMLREHNSGSTAWHNLCLKDVRTALGVPASAPTAIAAWQAIPKNLTHTWYNPPAGVPLFWGGGQGHVALADGHGNCWSNDIRRAGAIDLVPIGEITTKWGKPYLGWAEQVNGVRVYN